MIYEVDPLADPRWTELVTRHPSASVFHTREWLEALQRTYGYTPIAYTTSPSGVPLSNGIVMCQIRSWLTGRRIVSVPFSDHCEPLLDKWNSAVEIGEQFGRWVEKGEWKYIELRPMSEFPPLNGAAKAPSSCLHLLDLRPTADELFRRTHKTSVQQLIKRADREGITCEGGNSEPLLRAFYRLLIMTRRKHQLPPQPIQWFRNLAICEGPSLQIRVAFKDGKGIASILTLKFGNNLVYKYGCSDPAYKNLGGTQLLLWKAILEAKESGLQCMDFGRSDLDNPGLIAFKDRFGAQRSELTYLRWSRKQVSNETKQHSLGIVKGVFAIMPDSVLQATGRVLYRHIG